MVFFSVSRFGLGVLGVLGVLGGLAGFHILFSSFSEDFQRNCRLGWCLLLSWGSAMTLHFAGQTVNAPGANSKTAKKAGLALVPALLSRSMLPISRAHAGLLM